jgi:hypothetical protein
MRAVGDASARRYFNINRMMVRIGAQWCLLLSARVYVQVDDLHDIIVAGKRAAERTTRIKRYHQVYRFSTVPTSVVMV